VLHQLQEELFMYLPLLNSKTINNQQFINHFLFV
jgi:hypothetical protein